MYEEFFHLTRKPFDLVPNPDFLYLSKSHKKAITYLDYAIQERTGFILLTGEIGSGKTTIIRDLIKKHQGDIVLSKIFNTMVNSEQLIAMINDDFGIAGTGSDKTVLLRELNDFLIGEYGKGNKPVLIIDEAQNLAPDILEEIRMLSNLETDNAKLLQIILVGQPELRETLASPGLMQLRQRISCYCHIKPLAENEVERYILHRLEVAGNREAIVFPPHVVELIWRYSRGIPRLINIFCDFLLLAAFADGVKEIPVELAHEIVGDLDFENHFWGELGLPPAGTGEPIPSAGAPTGAAGSFEDADRAVLAEIMRRIETLERKDVPSTTTEASDEIRYRLDRYEQTLCDYMSMTEVALDELKRGLQVLKSSGVIDPPSREGERKRGFLEKLFRPL
jgi:putative secretion ATPase (PEP-CTERM system associated)